MILEIDGEKAILHTKVTPRLMNIMPQLEGQRRWLKAGGLKIHATAHNIEVLRGAVPDLVVKDMNAAARSPEEELWDVGAPLVPYEPKTPPMPHQEVGLKKIRKVKHPALWMEQGTGKSWLGITRAGELFMAGRITGVLVVAPRGVHRQWLDEQIPKHYSGEFRSVYWPLTKRDRTIDTVKPGKTLAWFAINWDAIRTKAGREACEAFIRAHSGRVLMIGDETQNIMNKDSARWRYANDIGQKCVMRIAMSGTPIAKALENEWAQLMWLDEDIIGIRFLSTFRRKYCILGGFTGREPVGTINLEDFKRKADPHRFRVTLDDIGILPPMHDRFRFDLLPEQRRLIADIKSDLLARWNDEDFTMAHAAVGVMRMRQVAAGYITQPPLKDSDGLPIPGTEKFEWVISDHEKNPRVQALMDLVNSKTGKFVIWAAMIPDFQVLKEVLGDEAVYYFGETSDAARIASKKRFIQDVDCRFFASNPSVGGVGLDGLQDVCHQAVYYTHTDNSINTWQSQKRTRRIGTTKIALYWDLVGVGSKDAGMLRNLAQKEDLSNMALPRLREWLEDEAE